MQTLNGFVKIHRKLLQWGWYQNHAIKEVWLHLLLTAAYKETPWQGIMIKPGQCVIGTERLAKELDFTRAQIRYALNKLKSTNEITIKTTNKYSIVTLVNWEDYQLINIDNSQQNHQQTNQQIANKKPTKSQQIATSEEIKNKRIKEYTRARARRNGF